MASTLALAAIALPAPWSGVAGAFSILGYSAVILQLSLHVSQTHTRFENLRRDMQRSAETKTAEREVETVDVRSARRIAYAIDSLEDVVDIEAAARLVLSEPRAARAPRVTVVVPCYNDERFVAETIRSVIAQSFEDWECIVVDDASTDGSLAEIWSASSGDERIRVLRHQVNGGLSAARNTGLRAARGKFITFLDSDDLLLFDSLLDRVATLANSLDDPHVIGSYSDVKVDLEDASLDDYPPRLRRQTFGTVDLVSADSECPFPAHGPVLVTETLRRLGGFDEKMRNGAEDWDLWYRAMRNGYIFVPSAYRTIVYRQKRGSMVREMADLHLEEAERLIDAAHQEVDPRILVYPSPTPLAKPLSYYQSMIRRADRSVRSATIALVSGRQDAARKALDVFEEAPLAMIERHVDIPGLVDRGIQRALSISPDDLASIEALALPIRRQINDIVATVAARHVTDTVSAPETPTVKALLAPQHGGQLPAMIEAASNRGYGFEDLAVLSVEREAGSQGVSEGIPDGIRTWSLNQWVLESCRASAVFVGKARVGVIGRFARGIAAEGGEIVVVEQPGDAEMELKSVGRPLATPANGSSPSGVRDLFLGLGAIREVDDNFEPTEAWQIEEYPGTLFDPVDIAAFKDRHRGERVVIIGNGPSLNRVDISALAAEHTIGVNGLFYASDRMGFNPTYYVVEDTAFMRDNLEAVREYRAGHKFFPSIYRSMIGNQPNVSYFMMNRGFYEQRSPDFCVPRFSTDSSQRLYSGQSVTVINLQLAFYLGFEEVVLIGMDFSYSIPESAVVKGDIVTSTGDDPNHFHPDYFGAGKVWKDPKLDRVLANYALAKRIYEADGRRIVNATQGGELELFDRVEFDRLFV